MASTPIGNGVNTDQFLQLFVTEMRNQNPLEPLDNTEFLTQLAQFTSVEQQSNMAANFEQVLKLTEFNHATGLIGNRVNFIDAETGYSTDGVVDGVTVKDNEVYLEIGSGLVLPSAVTSVHPT